MMLQLKLISITGIITVQRWIFNAICWFIFGYRNNGVNRILIYRTSALGDFLFAVPAMYVLRKRFPDAHIILLTTTTTQSGMREAVQQYSGEAARLPWLEFVVPSIIDDAICFSSLNRTFLLKEIKPSIIKLNPDLTFILSHPGDSGKGLLKKIALLKLLGVNRNVFGWRMRSSISCFRKTQHKSGMLEHKIFGPLRALEECSLFPKVTEMPIIFPLAVSTLAQEWAKRFLQDNKFEGAIIVAIAPGSIQPHKCWPEHKFIDLCKQLANSFKVKFLVIGTSNDSQIGEKIAATLPGLVQNVAGRSTIPQSAALLQRCGLLVGNDGGAMHLGAALGCKTVSIVPGIEYPGSIEPWGNASLSVRHEVNCAPCYSFTYCPKQHNQCMNDLPVAEVFARCAVVLGDTR